MGKSKEIKKTLMRYGYLKNMSVEETAEYAGVPIIKVIEFWEQMGYMKETPINPIKEHQRLPSPEEKDLLEKRILESFRKFSEKEGMCWNMVRKNILEVYDGDFSFSMLLQNAEELCNFKLLFYYKGRLHGFDSEEIDGIKAIKLYNLAEILFERCVSQTIKVENLYKEYENIRKRVKRSGKGMDSD